jgi:hypothetical protein
MNNKGEKMTEVKDCETCNWALKDKNKRAIRDADNNYKCQNIKIILRVRELSGMKTEAVLVSKGIYSCKEWNKIAEDSITIKCGAKAFPFYLELDGTLEKELIREFGIYTLGNIKIWIVDKNK